MTPNEFFERLAGRLPEIKAGRNTLTLSPGPMSIRIGVCDVWAVRLLLWLQEQMPADVFHPHSLTFGELEDVLLAALWWFHFWGAQYEEPESPADADPEGLRREES